MKIMLKMPMDAELIGYARVSTSLQETNMQIQQLWRAGAQKIYEEKTSSVGARPQLQKLFRQIKPGQVLAVYKLDRIARNLKDLLALLERLERLGCGLRSLTEPIDTTSSVGRLMIQMLGAVGEFERSLIRERVVAGQLAALRRGVALGRPKVVSAEQGRQAVERYEQGETVQEIANSLSVSESALRSAMYEARHGQRMVRRPRMPVLGPLLQN